MRLSILLCAALALPLAWAHAAPEQYRIHVRSPDSWADYYELIGLGNVRRTRLDTTAWSELTEHCTLLLELTGHVWLPLGYSVQRGFKLCYRTGPFTAKEAAVFCARLVMDVARRVPDQIVCEREHPLDYRQLNPYSIQ